MADKIFGEGLAPVPLKLVRTPAVVPAFEAEARPVYIEGLGSLVAGNRAAAQANSTATDVAGLVADFNALLAKLRTAGVIAP